MSQSNITIPVLGFAAFSGTGKTHLLKELINAFHARGIRVGIIKQSHHDFEIDVPGKDSYELRKAGAKQTLISSPFRWALIEENPEPETTLASLIKRLDHTVLDIILVEGFKHEPFAKIELHRNSLGKPLLYPEDNNIIAIATDSVNNDHHPIPGLDLNNPQQIMDFIYQEFL